MARLSWFGPPKFLSCKYIKLQAVHYESIPIILLQDYFLTKIFAMLAMSSIVSSALLIRALAMTPVSTGNQDSVNFFEGLQCKYKGQVLLLSN